MRRLSMLIALTLLAACGQSGDLYLPEPAQPESAAPAAPTPDEEKKKE